MSKLSSQSIKYQELPFEDTGNHTISIPDYQNYSQQNGLLKTMPQLQQFISQSTRQPRKILLNSPKIELRSQRSQRSQKSQRSQYSQRNQRESSIQQNTSQQQQFELNNNAPTNHPNSQQQLIRSNSLQNLSPFANSTVIFKRIAPNQTGLIPVTWNSCYCPKIKARQKSLQQQQSMKESFKRRDSRSYYDKGFYDYLRKYQGEQSPKLIESNSLYDRVMKQRDSQFHLPKKNTQQQQQSQKQFEEHKFYQTSPSTVKELDTWLHIDERSQTKPKMVLPNSIISNILQDSQDVLQNPKLVEQIIKLKKQQNLTKYDIVNFVKNNEKVKYIYNDYHTIGSRGGYSRGALGSFYTR